MKIRNIVHWSVRIAILLLFAGFSLASVWLPHATDSDMPSSITLFGSPLILERVLPAFSPFVAVMGMIARREWVLYSVWILPPLLVLLMAIWKGTWFCRWCCPLGTLQTLEARVSLKRKILTHNLGGYVIFACLLGAVLGFPLFMFFDPLAISSRVFQAFLQEGTALEWVAAGSILLILLLGLIQPLLWCIRICPLGYLQRLLHRVRFLFSCKEDACHGFAPVRRELLLGAALGIPAALLLRRFGLASEKSDPPILPPGAKDASTFAATCTRCYACVNACSTKVLRVSSGRGRGVAQMLEPELDFSTGLVCDYACNNCSHACPTAALAPLALEAKRTRQIGEAAVTRNLCMGWADDIDCMACGHTCPYAAIEDDFSEDGVPRPRVNPDKCRGCGYCETVCPIPEKAIRVRGVFRQRQLEDSAS